MSLVFYSYFHPSYLLLISFSIIVNHLFSYLLRGREENKRFAKCILILAVIFNLGLLGLFKYYDFFVSSINSVFRTDFPLLHILLPLGISFFTFQELGFVIDRCRKEAEYESFLDFAAFVVFFPQLVAGPIVSHKDVLWQIKDNHRGHFCVNNFTQGLTGFVYGLSKKVLIADTLGQIADRGYENIMALDTPCAFLVAIAFTLQLYFDFSGYSDMAIGLAKMIGIDLPHNFDHPFRSHNLKTFWTKWHITLSDFFTKYVYIPLGGNRKGKVRTCLNIFVVFVLSGLWHGAAVTFLIWGAFQGVFVVFNTAFPAKRKDNRFTHIVKCVLTFLLFSFGLIFFRAESLSDAVAFMGRLFSMESYHALSFIAYKLSYSELWIVDKLFAGPFSGIQTLYKESLVVVLIGIAIALLCGKNVKEKIESKRKTTMYALEIALLLTWCIISLSSVSSFLYFNF